MTDYKRDATLKHPAADARRRTALAAIVTVLAAAPFGSVTAQGKSNPKSGIAAKEKAAAATSEAQKWQKDALLVEVQTKTALPNGRAVNWIYLFNSPATKKQIGVAVESSGEVSRFDSPSYFVFSKAVGEFVDSEMVMAEAVKQGLKTHTWGMSMSLRNSDRPEWRMSDKDATFYVDGASGKFLRKEKD